MNEDLPSPLICDGDDTTPNNRDECMINNSPSRAINASDTAAYPSNVGRHITTETSDDDSRFSQTSKMSSVPNRANTTTSSANDDEERSVPGAGHENDTVPSDLMEFSDTNYPDADALTNDVPNKDDELNDADDGDNKGTDSDNEFDTNQDSDAEQSHDETDRSGTDEGGLFGWLDEQEANENVNFVFRIRTPNGHFVSVTKKRCWTRGWDLDKVSNTFPVVNCLDIVGLCAET